MNVLQEEDGSMVIEAAVIMPLFLAFLIAMISFVQIALADMALQSAVSETTKQVAAHMYPLYLIGQTDVGKDTQAMMRRIHHAKDEFASLETFAEDYAALIPEPILGLIGVNERIDNVLQAGVNIIVLPILKLYTDDKLINKDNLEVVDATLPNLFNKQQAYFGMTAQYKLKLFIPFIRKDIYIRKAAYERVWIGD